MTTYAACLAIAALAARADAQSMGGPRQGMQGGGGMHGMGGYGCAQGEGAGNHRDDMMLIHQLFADGSIRRTVREIPGGVETVTESGTPEGAERIRRHVHSMHERLQRQWPIHACDELFSEIFAHASEIDMRMENTPNGIKVQETAADPYVTALIRAHAQVVSKFLENGMREMHVRHPAPAH